MADKLEELGRVREAERVRAGELPQLSADTVELTGRGTYQGKVVYIGRATRDGSRVQVCGLPREDGSYWERWVPTAEVERQKEYAPREVRRGYGRHARTETVRQTLGGIARYLREQQAGKAAGLPQCAACGRRGDHLVRDLEDGLLKCPRCCDMPPG